MCLCCFHIFRHLSTNFHRYATGWSGTVQLAFVNSCNMLYWRSSYVDVQLVKAMLPGQASPSCVRAVVLADLRMSHIYLFMYLFIYVCMYLFIYVFIFYLCIYLVIFIYWCFVCLYLFYSFSSFIYTHVCRCVYNNVPIYKNMYMYMYIYIHWLHCI